MSKVVGYICGEDQTDISLGATDVVIYPTVEALKKKRTCWKECGIVEVKLGKFVEPYICLSTRKRLKVNKGEKL